MVREAAAPSIARIGKTMTAHPTIRVVLIGHTDDREAKQFAAGGDEIEMEGEPADAKPQPPAEPDLAALSADLSRARRGGEAGDRRQGHPRAADRRAGPRRRGAGLRQRPPARPAGQPARRDQALRPAVVGPEVAGQKPGRLSGPFEAGAAPTTGDSASYASEIRSASIGRLAVASGSAASAA